MRSGSGRRPRPGSVILRWILRELRNDIRFTLVFLLTLSIGMTGFLGLDSFRKGVAKNLSSKARELLGADLAISARRILTDAELSAARDPKSNLRALRETEFLEFFSMLNTQSTARLVQVRAIEPAFPFYGKIVFQSGRIHTTEKPTTADFLWIDRELAVQLDLAVGSRVKIWDKEFRVEEIVETDSTSSLGGGFMAPRAYVSLDSLKDRIGKFGSTLFYRRLFQFPAAVDGQEVQRLVEDRIPDSSVRVLAYNSAADESGRLIQYLSDYLGLVAVVGLLLASMGTFFLFQSYFSRKEKSIALARCLGLTFTQIQKIYFFEVALLGLGALAIGLFGISFVRTALISAMGDFLPPDLNFDL
ncbi:MAG: ABC transporter permease, partial [Bdellovibrionales bacterium]|nr:ABC transporter permease [Bdellovibrionales bacterium]